MSEEAQKLVRTYVKENYFLLGHWSSFLVFAVLVVLWFSFTLVICHYFVLSCGVFYQIDKKGVALSSGPTKNLSLYSVVVESGAVLTGMWILSRPETAKNAGSGLKCKAFWVNTTKPNLRVQVLAGEKKKLRLPPTSKIWLNWQLLK